MRDKVILTDADGVLLNWSDSFDAWMARRGHFAEGDVRLYNQTARYGWNVRESYKGGRNPILADALKWCTNSLTFQPYLAVWLYNLTSPSAKWPRLAIQASNESDQLSKTPSASVRITLSLIIYFFPHLILTLYHIFL
jgi:hypothetical protein